MMFLSQWIFFIVAIRFISGLPPTLSEGTMFADIRQFVELTDGTCNAVPGWEVTWEPQVGAL